MLVYHPGGSLSHELSHTCHVFILYSCKSHAYLQKKPVHFDTCTEKTTSIEFVINRVTYIISCRNKREGGLKSFYCLLILNIQSFLFGLCEAKLKKSVGKARTLN